MRDYNSFGMPARKIVHIDMDAFYASVEGVCLIGLY